MRNALAIYDTESYRLYYSLVVIAFLSVFLIIAAAAAATALVRPKGFALRQAFKIPGLVDADVAVTDSVIILIAHENAISRSSIFAFRDVRYTVGNGEKVLLDNVSGFATPGVLIALMGKSGAGKTTLLGMLSVAAFFYSWSQIPLTISAEWCLDDHCTHSSQHHY